MFKEVNNPMISKICLGTVQFGLDYGIANHRGKVPKPEVFEIFKYAQEIGLRTLDTSMAYGDSEIIIGEFGKPKIPFEIVSKILIDSDVSDSNNMRSKLQDSLQRLKIKQLYACLIHRFEDFLKHGQIWEVLKTARQEGLVKKIGFSLYRPEELELIWDRGVSFDIVQVPFSIFDRRFEKYFELLKEKNIEIHVRSVFLQGLAFLKPDQLPEKLRYASGTIDQLQNISQRHNLPIGAVCLNYVLLNSLIDKVVIGVDSLEHLKKNVHNLEEFNKVSDLRDNLKDLAISDEEVLLPFKWN